MLCRWWTVDFNRDNRREEIVPKVGRKEIIL